MRSLNYIDRNIFISVPRLQGAIELKGYDILISIWKRCYVSETLDESFISVWVIDIFNTLEKY